MVQFFECAFFYVCGFFVCNFSPNHLPCTDDDKYRIFNSNNRLDTILINEGLSNYSTDPDRNNKNKVNVIDSMVEFNEYASYIDSE